MIRIINSQDKTKTKLVSKEVYKESLINSFVDGIIGHFNDADFFFTDIKNGYLKYVAESIDKVEFKNLVNELIEEGYAPNLDTLNLEEQIQYLYQNKLVDNYDLYELIDKNKLADLMMENKCGWVFSIDDTDNSFYTDLEDLDLTEVTHERKEYGVGDSINIGNITGIIEDYDDKYFYIKDNNANVVKVSKSLKDLSRLAYEYEPEEEIEENYDNPFDEEEEEKRLEAEERYVNENFEEENSPLDYTLKENLSKNLDEVLSTLDERERKIIEMRFGLNGEQPQTLEAIGKVFNINKERVRQIEGRALRKLKHPKHSNILKPYVQK